MKRLKNGEEKKNFFKTLGKAISDNLFIILMSLLCAILMYIILI